MDTKAIMACGFLFLGGIALLIMSVLTNSSIGLGISVCSPWSGRSLW